MSGKREMMMGIADSHADLVMADLKRPAPAEPKTARPSIPVARPVAVARGWKRYTFFAISAVFFTLGALGALLPVLPASPFLLLSSYFLIRSSPRLNERLLRSRFFGPILTDWQVHGGIRRHVKVKAVITVALAVGVTVLLTGYSLLPSLMVVLLAAVGIGVIVRLPEAKEVVGPRNELEPPRRGSRS